MTFIIHLKSGRRITYNSRFNNEDAAWEDVYDRYPDADYIEQF